jgi:hypothetical protein
MALEKTLKSDRAQVSERNHPQGIAAEGPYSRPDRGREGDPLLYRLALGGGVAMAGEKIAEGETTNAFAFISAGGHHSGRDYFGGYCCFNDVALCIVNLREKYGIRRSPSWIPTPITATAPATFFHRSRDPPCLHVRHELRSADGTKVDVACTDPHGGTLAGRPMNEQYRPCGAALPGRVRRFQPDVIFGISASTPTRATTATSGLPGHATGTSLS